MAIQSKHQQLKKAADYFQPAKESVVMRTEFADQLEEQLVAKYISYQTNKMETKKSFWQASAWTKGVALAGMAAIFVLAGLLIQQQSTLDVNNNTGTIIPTTLSGDLAYFEGEVEYRKAGEAAGWMTVQNGMDFNEGDSIRTFEDGRAIINLDDGSAIRLNYNSEVELTALDPQEMQITNLEGEVYTRVAKLDREFAVLTDEARYLSLGTAYTTLNTESDEGVKVFESKVQVELKDSGDQIIVNEGEEFDKKTKEKDSLTVEEIKKDEFALWNKQKDEQNEEYKDMLGKLADLEAPSIKLNFKNGATVSKAKFIVSGETEAGAEVKVKGKVVNNDNGSFSKQVNLKEGLNKFYIVVSDLAGNQTSQVVKVTYNAANDNSGSQPTDNTGTGITITSVQVQGNGIKVTWSVNGLSTPQGFKVVYGTGANPTYPANNPTYFSDPGTRSAFINVSDGKTYHFRVCRYLDGSCDSYSNNATATAPSVSPITSLSASFNGSNKLTWTTNTGTLGQGFKIAYSETNPNPNYPDQSIAYIDGFEYSINKNGYYRICAWNGGGGCTAVSSVIEVTNF